MCLDMKNGIKIFAMLKEDTDLLRSLPYKPQSSGQVMRHFRFVLQISGQQQSIAADF